MNGNPIPQMVKTIKTARDAGYLKNLVPHLEQQLAEAESQYHKVRDWRGKDGQQLAPDVIWTAKQRVSKLKIMLKFSRPQEDT